MDDRNGSDRRFYSFRDELIDAILMVNDFFAEGPDRLTREDLGPYSDDALDDEYDRQCKLLYDDIKVRVAARSTGATQAEPDKHSGARCFALVDPGPGHVAYRSPSSDQFIWERSG